MIGPRTPRTLADAMELGRRAGDAARSASMKAGGRRWNPTDDDEAAAEQAARAELQRLGMIDAMGDGTDLHAAWTRNPRAAWPAPLPADQADVLATALPTVRQMQLTTRHLLTLSERHPDRRGLERDVATATTLLEAAATDVGLTLDRLLEHANARLAIKRLLREPMRAAA